MLKGRILDNMNFKITKESLVYIIMLLLSVIMIIFGVIYSGTMTGDILLNIGLSIVSTVLIYFLLKLSDDPMKPIVDKVDEISKELNESIDLLKDERNTGISRVWNVRSELETKEWLELIKNSNGDIKILCYAMAFLIDDADFDDIIRNKILEGKKIQILIGKPNGENIKKRTLEENSEGDINERISRLFSRLKKINNNVSNSNNDFNNYIELRYHDTPLYSSIYIFGDFMIVNPQLYGVRGAKAPILGVKKISNKNCLYNEYYNVFMEIWNNQSEEA